MAFITTGSSNRAADSALKKLYVDKNPQNQQGCTYSASCGHFVGHSFYRVTSHFSPIQTVKVEWRTLLNLLDIFVRSSKESLTRPFDSDELDNNLYSIVQSQEDGQPTWCLPSPQHTPTSTEDVDGSMSMAA